MMDTSTQKTMNQAVNEAIFAGNGEMAALMRAFDWSATPLGPVQSWSPALRTIVPILLANRFPMLLWWGPHYIQFYNDAYRPILGDKHPQRALGQPVSECWSEIWEIIGPLIDTPFRGGPATWMDDILLILKRYGYEEETHFTIAYSPVPDETAPAGVGGVLATVQEITEKVIGERQLALLREVASALTATQTTGEVTAAITQCIEANSRDLPFALLYLLDGEDNTAHLACATGIPSGHPLAVPIADTRQTDTPWPLTTLMTERVPVLIDNLPQRFGSLPCSPWDKQPQQAIVSPIAQQGQERLAGFLVTAINPYRKYDADYQGFIHLLAVQITSSLANVRAYEEEKKRAEALAELDQAKTAFFSNVSHEFRTPLTLMLGPMEDALSEDGQALAGERLQTVHRNTMRLLKLVNTLLDFSRIEAERVQASYQPTDLANFTRELASVFQSAVEKAGMRLIVDCSPLSEPVYVDRDMWEKIVLNLLSNAFKFTFEGEIEVTLRQQDQQAILSIRDTGTGISKEQLPHIFERFHRVEGTRARTHEGTGIGLALVQELVKLHGGAVGVESTEGIGTTFIVTLPLGKAHLPPDHLSAPVTLSSTALRAETFVEEALRWLPEESQAIVTSPYVATSPSSQDSQTESKGRTRVLLADDNADMRGYVQRLLNAHYDVIAVANGAEALRCARETRIDLVLSDVMMPELDGFALLRELRSDPQTASIPIILLSARAGEEARIEGLSSGADDYITKPFNARELLASVRAHINVARLRDEAAQVIRSLNVQLSADLEGMARMQQLSMRLVQAEDFTRLLAEIVDAAIDITQADMGNIQLLEDGVLKIAAHRGFDSAFLDFFRGVHEGQAACGTAMQHAGRVVVEDIANDPIFDSAPVRNAVLDSGARAVQSTPLISRSGRVIGMFSTHYRRTPHRPSERELHLLDILARLAADLIEYRQAETALRHRSEQFETLLNQAPLGVYLIDADFRIREVNPIALPVFGDIPGGVVGRDFEEIIHILWEKQYADEIVRIFRHTLETGESYFTPEHAKFRIDRGIMEYYEWRLDRITLPDGRYGLVCYFRDTSQQIQAQRAIETSQEQVRAIANQLALVTDTAPVYIAQCDRESRFKFVNRAYAERFGLTAEECIGKRIPEVVGEAAYEAFRSYTERVLQGEAVEFDVEIPYAGIGSHFMHCSYAPEHDAEGTVVGWVAAITDITERRRIEEALGQRNSEVQALNMRLQRAMTETHHRVKNNLQLISALIDMQRSTDVQMIPMSELARLGANVRALGVIHDILTQEAKGGSDQETLSVKAVLEGLMQVLEQTTGGRTLVFSFDDARLAGRQTTTLALVTNELVSNALKHGKGNIEIYFRVNGNTATLEVCDDGPGFPEGFNAETASNTGLELVENIVRWDLRGKIAYDNRPQGGAQIGVTFPL